LIYVRDFYFVKPAADAPYGNFKNSFRGSNDLFVFYHSYVISLLSNCLFCKNILTLKIENVNIFIKNLQRNVKQKSRRYWLRVLETGNSFVKSKKRFQKREQHREDAKELAKKTLEI
jgi:hypothetical protein